jgi:toxin-antitoxin system PIN domain toxin
MRALLDVNVLIALLDADHASHRHAMDWFVRHADAGWASTPITENGCVRIMSHPAYPNAQPLREVVERLHAATANPVHEFWPDSLSVTEERWFDASRIHGPRQLTDVYLLALAVDRGGRLVTFDSGMALDAVNGAAARHLLVL